MALVPEDPVPINLETTLIEPMNIRYCGSGKVSRERGNLVLKSDEFDFHPLKVSERFLEQRRLCEGDHYVIVEYENMKDDRVYIDVWKAREI
jgi:hypothetical protein